MHYGYIRKLEQNKYIGFCILLNGIMLKDVHNLFHLFEDVVSFLVSEGRLIRFDERGKIVASVHQLNICQDETEIVREYLRNVFLSREIKSEILPPLNYSIAKNTIKYFSVGDKLQNIISSSIKSGYTFVYKSKDYNTLQINSYQKVLANITSENESLKRKVHRQRNQMGVVISLLALILISLVGLTNYHQKLNLAKVALGDSEQELSLSEKMNTQRKDTIKILKEVISDLQSSLTEIRKEKQTIDTNYLDLKDMMPIIIRGVEIGCLDRGESFKIDYGGLLFSDKIVFLQPRIIYQGIKKEGKIALYCKLYTPSGNILSCKASPIGFTTIDILNVVNGENSVLLSRWGGSNWTIQWEKGDYRFEIWYRDICLKTKTFTIY